MLDSDTLIQAVFDIISMYRLTEKEDRICQTTKTVISILSSISTV